MDIDVLIEKKCKDIKYNILIIEDSKVISDILSNALKQVGHSVTQGYSVSDFQKYINDNEYDFIILDLILPDGDGINIIENMSVESRGKVIVLSGTEEIDKRRFVVSLGILDYFSKTTHINLIVEDIKKLICNLVYNPYMNVLIVDDAPYMLQKLHDILKPKRYNIILAKSAKEGLDILYKEDIHMLFLDFEMPEMDGAEMLEEIKKEIKFFNLPVIIISGGADEDTIARVLKYGACDFITKPFIIEELLLKCDFHIQHYINLLQNEQNKKELEKALTKTREAEEYKAMFLANMSHEIRTPLNAIIGFNDILLDKNNDNDTNKYLKTMKESSKLLLNIINDILDFSKIESNKLDINKKIFILKDIEKNVLAMHENTIENKGLNLKISTDDKLPEYFHSDFLRIKQIVTNLISNAIKFTPKGGDIIFGINYTEDKNSVIISVSDTGIGIDPKNHKKIFEVFSQAESDTTQKYGGTGLGLAISSNLATMLDGTIGMKSELGQGSKFYITLPIEDINQSDIEELGLSKEKPVDNSHLEFKNHILLVEDNKVNQMYMKVLLKKFGLTFDIAGDGKIAVELYKNNKYDLILMDENMPNMNGTEATEIIRNHEYENNFRNTPIIALTANAIKGDREKFIEAGMDEYITKPVDKIRLGELFTEFLTDDRILDMCKKEEDKNLKEEENLKNNEFIKETEEFLISIENSIKKNNFGEIKIFADILKSKALKYKLQDIFTICLKIKLSAKEKDIQSCKNYLYLIRNNGVSNLI